MRDELERKVSVQLIPAEGVWDSSNWGTIPSTRMEWSDLPMEPRMQVLPALRVRLGPMWCIPVIFQR